jgi:hypothetical protein
VNGGGILVLVVVVDDVVYSVAVFDLSGWKEDY